MPLRVAVVGAESTGKTTLVSALDTALQAQGLTTHRVDEVLRAWCDTHQRTPLQHEQHAIAAEQMRRVNDCRAVQVCLSDTAALMTAVYSDVIFGDTSLYETAALAHRAFDVTLLTDLALPWVEDGLQRDGVHLRAPVDAALRAALHRFALPFAEVRGTGSDRTASALQQVLLALSMRGVRPGVAL